MRGQAAGRPGRPRPVRRVPRRHRRTCNGHYLPNPALLLRKGDGWQPVYQALGLDWLDRGAGKDEMFSLRPGLVVDTLSAPD